MKKKNILITGAAGFLGTYLAKACVEAGHNIYGIDIKLPLQKFLWAGFMRGCLEDVDLTKFLQGIKLDICFHLAGPASVPYSMEHPYNDFNQLLPATAKLLEYIIKKQPKSHLVFYSSAAVYGDPKRLPVSEKTIISPISPYGIHKHTAETLIQHYSYVYGLKASILRIFSAYGAGLKRQIFWDVLNKYFEAIKKGKSNIELFGSGRELRDYIHAKDIANASLLAASNPNPKAIEVINVANGQKVTIREAAQILLKGCKIKVRYKGKRRPGEPVRWIADISRLKRLGYKPSVTLEKGLSEYLLWYNQAKNIK